MRVSTPRGAIPTTGRRSTGIRRRGRPRCRLLASRGRKRRARSRPTCCGRRRSPRDAPRSSARTYYAPARRALPNRPTSPVRAAGPARQRTAPFRRRAAAAATAPRGSCGSASRTTGTPLSTRPAHSTSPSVPLHTRLAFGDPEPRFRLSSFRWRQHDARPLLSAAAGSRAARPRRIDAAPSGNGRAARKGTALMRASSSSCPSPDGLAGRKTARPIPVRGRRLGRGGQPPAAVGCARAAIQHRWPIPGRPIRLDGAGDLEAGVVQRSTRDIGRDDRRAHRVGSRELRAMRALTSTNLLASARTAPHQVVAEPIGPVRAPASRRGALRLPTLRTHRGAGALTLIPPAAALRARHAALVESPPVSAIRSASTWRRSGTPCSAIDSTRERPCRSSVPACSSTPGKSACAIPPADALCGSGPRCPPTCGRHCDECGRPTPRSDDRGGEPRPTRPASLCPWSWRRRCRVVDVVGSSTKRRPCCGKPSCIRPQ